MFVPDSSSATPLHSIEGLLKLQILTPIKLGIERFPLGFVLSKVIQDTLNIGQKYSSVPRVWERVSERASERVSAAERASEASSVEQANE